MPSLKRKFAPDEITISSMGNLIDRWLQLAGDYGHIELSGWQGIEESNAATDDIGSAEGFLHAYATNPPRIFLSARAELRSVALTVDYLRGRIIQIAVSFPELALVQEVFAALDARSSHEMREPLKPAETYTLDVELPGQTERLPSSPLNEGAQSSCIVPQSSPIVQLNWNEVTAEEFERILFNIVAEAKGYMNPQWLMNTNAPDRGRDISVERTTSDTLSGTRTQRVIIQAKHWLSKSIRPLDISGALTGIPLWEPPRVHALVIATTGRFTADAISWVERYNDVGKQPLVET